MIQVPLQAKTGQFETGLCSCMEDMGVCATACFIPCWVAPNVWAHVRGEECQLCHCCAPVSQVWASANIRQARGATPDYCTDCCAHTFCQCCALSRNAIEVNKLKAYTSGVCNETTPVAPPPGYPQPGMAPPPGYPQPGMAPPPGYPQPGMAPPPGYPQPGCPPQ